MAHITIEFEEGTVAYLDVDDDTAENICEWIENTLGIRMNLAT